MNTLQLATFNMLGTSTRTDATLFLQSSNSSEFLNAFVQMLMVGKNIRTHQEQMVFVNTNPVVRPRTVFSFESEFSFSNIPSTNIALEQSIAYDTKTQGVMEVGDKPYAVKGLTAVILTNTPADDAKIRPNLDDYVKIHLPSVSNAAGTARVDYYVYFGSVNNSKTDFYTPFADLDATSKVMYFDTGQSQAKVIGQQVAQATVSRLDNQPINTSKASMLRSL